MSRLRVFCFPRAERAITIYVPDDVDVLTLPPLPVPFTLVQVAEALGDRARVSDEEPGRWGPAIHKARLDLQAARGQQQKEREARQAHVLLGSNEPGEVERSKLIQEKHVVDDRIRVLKTDLLNARQVAATKGKFLPRSQYQSMQRELDGKRERSLAIQARLGELRAERKKTGGDDNQRFRTLVRELAPDLYEEVIARIEDEGIGKEETGT